MKRQETDITLSALVIRHLDAFLEETSIKREAFLKEQLLPMLVKHRLLGEPEHAEEYAKWVNSQAKRLSRYMSGENELKADWVFPILAALPFENRKKAMLELCGFFGTHYVPISAFSGKPTGGEVEATLSAVSKEFSDVLIESAPAMDGVYNHEDNPAELLKYANELYDLTTSCFVELGKIYKATGVLPAAYRSMALSPLFK
ncbi:hypothetical protein H2666_17145 [Vibrio cholerae]|uniref:hypothetical protein n=1 Tax=Vibrio cholerae TaxID=666 RepID=UPI002FDC6740|nr:hypothetical protein [Vibrio cholerae]HDI3293407.1 hypothetical protein [Vibrio cholerae]HDI3318769.1 hypothetical protein [Vibrio cholerae]